MELEELKQKLYASGDKKDFIHLHLHSDFSLKDGIGKPTQYAKKAIEIGMSALAITDHGSIGAHPSFFMYCRSNNLKPIVGVEMYMQNERHLVKELEVQIDKIESVMKVVKQIVNKKISQKLVNANIAIFDHIMGKNNVEEILELDSSEIKEAFGEELKKLKQQQEELSKQRDHLKYNRHVVLLAKNEKGRRNIIKIVSDAARNGFYYKPRTAFNFLAENKEGLIVSSACLAGSINNAILRNEDNNVDSAKKAGIEVAKQFKEIFGDDFYIEIMIIDIDKQRYVNRILIDIAKELNIKYIITNDVHYLDKEDSKAQEISLMLGSKDDGQQVTMKDKKRMNAIGEILDAIKEKCGETQTESCVRQIHSDFIELDRFAEFRLTSYNKDYGISFEEIYEIITGKKKFKRVWEFATKDLWFKDRHQMIDTYLDAGHSKYMTPDELIEGLNNTLEVANKVNIWDWDSKEKLPRIVTKDNQSSYEYLVEMAREGWERKATDLWDDVYIKRVKTELSVIRKTDMADYFLIVADYIKFAKQNNVLVGSARGSAAGSLVCYLLDITNVDPIIHGLLFERFLSMSRSVAIYDFSIRDFNIESKVLKELDYDQDDFDKWYENRLIKEE